MKTVLHEAESRGHANHGWLDSYHTFSFGDYYDAERIHFGSLRVLNDDTVSPSMGFSTHPHNNMEIVSIPLEGDLEHKDNMNNVSIIKQGDVQVMSAGTGVFHSEKNKNRDKEVKFLQIWIFPREKNVEPRYDQISIESLRKENEFYLILSPNTDDDGVWIHQDAWFHLGHFEEGSSSNYKLKKEGNGLYLFVLNGLVEFADKNLSKRDGIGIWEVTDIEIKIKEKADILLMEVPMS